MAWPRFTSCTRRGPAVAGPGSLGWLALGGAEGVAALTLVGADPGLGLPLVSQADPGGVLALGGELDDLDLAALPGDLGLPAGGCLLAGNEWAVRASLRLQTLTSTKSRLSDPWVSRVSTPTSSVVAIWVSRAVRSVSRIAALVVLRVVVRAIVVVLPVWLLVFLSCTYSHRSGTLSSQFCLIIQGFLEIIISMSAPGSHPRVRGAAPLRGPVS